MKDNLYAYKDIWNYYLKNNIEYRVSACVHEKDYLDASSFDCEYTKQRMDSTYEECNDSFAAFIVENLWKACKFCIRKKFFTGTALWTNSCVMQLDYLWSKKTFGYLAAV